MHRAAFAVMLSLALVACGSGASKASPRRHRSTTTSTTRTASTTSTTVTAPSSTTTTPDETTTTTTTPSGRCGAQSAAITSAIEGSDVGGLAAQRGNFTVQRCRIAASNPIWAAANTVPNDPTRLDTAVVVLQRIGALWTVMDVGTADVGCMAPASVQHDLGLAC